MPLVQEGRKYLHQVGKNPSLWDEIVLVRRINHEKKSASVIGERGNSFCVPLVSLIPLDKPAAPILLVGASFK